MRNTLEHWLAERNGVLVSEPVNLGRDMFLTHTKAPKGRVIYHHVVMKIDEGDGWKYIGWVRALYGYRKGLYEASVYWGHLSNADRVAITAECATESLAVEMLVAICQKVRP